MHVGTLETICNTGCPKKCNCCVPDFYTANYYWESKILKMNFDTKINRANVAAVSK